MEDFISYLESELNREEGFVYNLLGITGFSVIVIGFILVAVLIFITKGLFLIVVFILAWVFVYYNYKRENKQKESLDL